MPAETRSTAIRIALSVTALEFFGPAVRDLGASHALNPDWVGHARVHLVWLIGFMVLSGLVNVYLLWFRRPRDERDVWLSATWQSCNLGGFWLAFLFRGSYGGEMTMPGIHVHILGIDENVFVFSILTIVLANIWLALVRGTGSQHAAA